MPDNQASEKYELLEAMGAEVRKVPPVPFANQTHFFHQARKLAEANGWCWANQFENPPTATSTTRRRARSSGSSATARWTCW